ncbi:hypothetical protein lerEdw1_013501 [Lerista edwardsae]|nr:hypothetical protein lerEdw1_013502 [Lerista edwardsae]KAJ6650229.1 hypothetical protein lerEdw1_013501 [Lerista edwardsae]
MDHGPKEGDAAGAVAGDSGRGAAGAAASSSGGVVVQVREKKGPLRAAIPYMPFPVAVICLFLNTFVPGLGLRVVAERREVFLHDPGCQRLRAACWGCLTWRKQRSMRHVLR